MNEHPNPEKAQGREPLSRRQLMKASVAFSAAGAAAALLPRQTLADDSTTTQTNAMEATMMLATTTVENVEQFLKIFATTSLVKRKQHGSKGATVFQDPNETDRVWVIFDWDVEGFKKFASDPEVPAIMKEAGHKSKPQIAAFANHYSA